MADAIEKVIEVRIRDKDALRKMFIQNMDSIEQAIHNESAEMAADYLAFLVRHYTGVE